MRSLRWTKYLLIGLAWVNWGTMLSARNEGSQEVQKATLTPQDPLLRPPYFEAGSTAPGLDCPGQLTGYGYGNQKGILLDTGKVLLWSADEFGGFAGAAGLWNPSNSRFEPIPVNLNSFPPKQHLAFRDGQILIDDKPAGSPVWYSPFQQAWVKDEPISINWRYVHGGWRKRPIPGGWILQQDETPGGSHAWELVDPKTGAKKSLTGIPLTGKEVGRSDGCIVFISGKQSQILDPKTGDLKPGPEIKLSAWEECCSLPGDKILLAGGAVQTSPLPQDAEPDGYEGYFKPIRGLYELDLNTFAVKRVAMLRYDRIRGFAMIPTPDGKLLIAGGTYGFGPNGTSPTPEVQWLDLKTYHDCVGYRLLADRRGALIRGMDRGKVIIVGGRTWEGGGYHQQNLVTLNTPELLDPSNGCSVALKPIPAGFRPIQILQKGILLLYDAKNDKPYPQLPEWPMKLVRFDPMTGHMESAGELRTTHPRNHLKSSTDRMLFMVPTDLNQANSTATSVEIWDGHGDCRQISIPPYRYLRLICELRDGSILFQSVGSNPKQNFHTFVFTPHNLEIREIENPSGASSSLYGFQLRDGRILLCRGWQHNYSMHKSYYFLDEVWDPTSGKYSLWPADFLVEIEDRAMKRKDKVPKISLIEVAQAVGLSEKDVDPSFIAQLLHPVQGQEPHVHLKDGRILFINGSKVSFYPDRTNSQTVR